MNILIFRVIEGKADAIIISKKKKTDAIKKKEK